MSRSSMESSRHPSGPGLMTSRLIVSHLSLHGVVPLRTSEVGSLPLMAQLEAEPWSTPLHCSDQTLALWENWGQKNSACLLIPGVGTDP